MHHLQRRDFNLGTIPQEKQRTMPDLTSIQQAWTQDQSILLPALLKQDLSQYTPHIQQACKLIDHVLDTNEVVPFLEQPPYSDQLKDKFFIAAISTEEHDEQAIEKIYFNRNDNEYLDDFEPEDLWCKIAWLSFHEEDASLRFRFSCGMDGYEKQTLAGELCDALFPESLIVTQNNHLIDIFKPILNKTPAFVERIVYFNAPNGGAQMHHDVERGHAGVVFAQLSGQTFWLALTKQQLMDEIIAFVHNQSQQPAIQAILPNQNDRDTMLELCQNRHNLSDYMEQYDHELIEAIIDRSPEFIQQLIEQGYSHQLIAGDVLLLPQRDLDHCVWHSVFTLGDDIGEALSFAIR